MSTLKKPLFINGMYNREGKNCRADFVREVSNGAELYKLWTCTEKNQYPANERDRYFLYVEINNYLVPLENRKHGRAASAGRTRNNSVRLRPCTASGLYPGSSARSRS